MVPTSYLEAYWTGIPVGDPIKTSAIGAVLRYSRTLEDPLYM